MQQIYQFEFVNVRLFIQFLKLPLLWMLSFLFFVRIAKVIWKMENIISKKVHLRVIWNWTTELLKSIIVKNSSIIAFFILIYILYCPLLYRTWLSLFFFIIITIVPYNIKPDAQKKLIIKNILYIIKYRLLLQPGSQNQVL